MDRSSASIRELTCLSCNTSFSFNIWEIVDVVERPDLLGKIIEGSLHDAYCPNCRELILKIDSPLLVYRSNQKPIFIYSSAEETVLQADQAHFMRLMDHFKPDLGPDWPSNWQEIVKAPLPREILSVYLREGPKAAEIAYLEVDKQKQATAAPLSQLIREYVLAKSKEQIRKIILDNFSFITSFRAVGYFNEIIQTSINSENAKNIKLLEGLLIKRDLLIHFREIGLERTARELYEDSQSVTKLTASQFTNINKSGPNTTKQSFLFKIFGSMAGILSPTKKTRELVSQKQTKNSSTQNKRPEGIRAQERSQLKTENTAKEKIPTSTSLQPIFTRVDQLGAEDLQNMTNQLNELSTGEQKLPEAEIKNLICKLLGDYDASQDEPNNPKIIIAVAWVDEPDQEVIEITKNLLFNYRLKVAGFNNTRILELPTKITPENGKQTAKIIGRQLKADIVLWLQRAGVGEFLVNIEVLTNRHLDGVREESRLTALNDADNLNTIQFIINNQETFAPLCSFLSGLALFQDRLFTHAIALFNDAISLSKWDDCKKIMATAYYYRALSKLCLNDLTDAISDYSEAIKNLPDNSRFYSKRGSVYGYQKQPDKAMDDYSYAIFLDPSESSPYLKRGCIYSDHGKCEEAISDFSNCIKNDPTNSEAYFLRGCEYGKMRQEDLAIADFSKTIELNPQKSAAYANRGWAYNIKGDHKSAIEDFSIALVFDPKDEDTLSKRGEAYRHVGEIDKSIIDLDLAISLDPTHSDSFLARGLSFVKKGEITRAFADLNMAVQLDPKNANAIAMRGNLYGIMGDRAKAVSDLQIATDLNPEYRDLLNSHQN